MRAHEALENDSNPSPSPNTNPTPNPYPNPTPTPNPSPNPNQALENDTMLDEWVKAKRQKNYAEADRLRDELRAKVS
eukprot:scaffold94368_cov42-Phaeocystis_antarctica.AAC.2